MLKKIFYKIPVLINLIKHPIKSVVFFIEFIRFKTISDDRFKLKIWQLYPCLKDKTSNTHFDSHYLYHPAWAARIIANEKPTLHVDISSTLNFCAIISAFVPVEFYDYRPAKLNLSNLKTERADLTKLPFENNSIESLSCMHTVEHVGLGRYGDKLDVDGDLKAAHELKRVLAINGNLLFVVPIGGISKIQFNAHRIYRYDQVKDMFNGLKLINFSLVTDDGNFLSSATMDDSNEQEWGCGCFWFKKYDRS